MTSDKSSALKKKELDEQEEKGPEIISWPDINGFMKTKEKSKERISLDEKYLYYKGKKIPILQFQKSGYDKLLQLLVKEIGR